MSITYIIRRIILFFVVVWAATSFIFILPKLVPGRNPVTERLGMMAASGGIMQGAIDAMAKSYEAKFGLDQPLWKQYLTYVGQMVNLDFGYSLMLYPAHVLDLILRALPWTIGLLTMTTILSFAIGSVLGGMMAWSKAPRFVSFLLPPLFTLSAIPYYLLGMILVYILAFRLRLFPMSGGAEYGTVPTLTVKFALDVLRHSLLPALSIILSSVGFWALGMRGMMVTTTGEDYMTLAEAKGLSGIRVFLWYAMRNAILPQTTSLALSLGNVLSGALLVEIIFGFPGIGTLLYQAITAFDYFTIYGVVFCIIVAVGLATLVLDLCYPILDPRIRYHKA
jgi:peptide/nickel transport system permease protein